MEDQLCSSENKTWLRGREEEKYKVRWAWGWGLGLVRLRLAAVSAPQLSLTFISLNKSKTFNHYRFDRALGYARQLSSWGTTLTNKLQSRGMIFVSHAISIL